MTIGSALGPPPRKRGSYAKTAETRSRILAAAHDVARELGFHGVSLAEVAHRAGVAVGNVSYHFGSREELLHEVMQGVADRLREAVVQAGVAGRDVFERGEAALRAYLAFLRAHPWYVQMSEQVRSHRPDIYRRNLVFWLDLHRSAVREGIEEGTLRPMTDEELTATAYLIVGAHYFVDQMIEGTGGQSYPGDDIVVAAYMKLFRGGLESARERKPSQESES